MISTPSIEIRWSQNAPLTPEQIARGRAAGRKLAENYYQNLQAAALGRWWLREIQGRYLGEA